MEPATLRTEVRSNGVDEGGDIVVRRPFELRNSLDARNPRTAASRLGRGGRHVPDLRPRVERGQLDCQPPFELASSDHTRDMAGLA